MTKDVMINVRGLQFLEGDSEDEIETVQRGQYYERDGNRFLLFDEYLEGFSEPVKNLIRFKDGEMALTKRGIINVQITFAEGKKHQTRYQTPYGVIMIGMDTSRVAFRERGQELELEVDYTLEANYQYVADCQIRIEARPGKQE
ncbi:MAG: DUF1934 domain-containing protein [Eubacteriales bacterium]|nr:DUF1934 domain-containing protein [Eubacteriales bacterium]